mmetsp:Transcript_44572/g.82670  ORF Transcript_44572/g.82670 Transcript_44572/m.82670 type:complete len:528 (-) Transcript_44572:291-1874(-)|eukprot:CAMPEP_0197448602 /NCGR_PEP_ID=MMETSP1175-20131217/18173_1 /TAXON_ID=1003142 /ORGANISM="Triceratium dubium, Strain CCMP147" /LENGTH=527 /DNA_ID=CAMNT_0042980417 /DNA_START=134 /DNA_END=1717 /DNA_ORIENTATION=-
MLKESAFMDEKALDEETGGGGGSGSVESSQPPQQGGGGDEKRVSAANSVTFDEGAAKRSDSETSLDLDEAAEKAVGDAAVAVENSQSQFNQSSAGGGNGSKKGLSVVSKKYDLGNKGYLDENEKILRQYDTDNNGELDLREVYKIVENVRRQQAELNHDRKKIHNLKVIIIALVCFTLVLTLAMLGVSFAAAKLAKDTTANARTSSLEVRATGEPLSTVGAASASTMKLPPPPDAPVAGEGRRRRSLVEGDEEGASSADATEPGGSVPRKGRGMKSLMQEEGRKRGMYTTNALTRVSHLGRHLKMRMQMSERERRLERERRAQVGCLLPCRYSSSEESTDESTDDSDTDTLSENRLEDEDFNEDIINCLDVDPADPDGRKPEFTISEVEYDRIYEEHFTGTRQTNVVLSVDENSVDASASDIHYQITMKIEESWSEQWDGGRSGSSSRDDIDDEAFMLFFCETRMHCPGDSGSNAYEEEDEELCQNGNGACTAYQPIFFFGFCGKCDGCSSSECGVFTCANGLRLLD